MNECPSCIVYSKQIDELVKEANRDEELYDKQVAGLTDEITELEARCLGLGKDKELLKVEVIELEYKNKRYRDTEWSGKIEMQVGIAERDKSIEALRSSLKLGVEALEFSMEWLPAPVTHFKESIYNETCAKVKSALSKMKESLQ